MSKPMIKIYIVLVASLALCILFAPGVLGYTSAWASETTVKIRLLAQRPAQAAEDTTGKARIVFVMDDGWDTQYTQGYAILKEYGFSGCIAVIPAAVDTEHYMTYTELADLYIDGWDMLNHTNNHVLLTGLPQDEQAQQMIRAKEWLESHRLQRGSDIVVFPGGEFDDVTLETLALNGFAAGRSLKSLWTAQAGCSLEDVEICNLVYHLNFEYVQSAIDKAIRTQSVLIVVVHKIEPVTDGQHMQLPPEYFSRIVAYIHAHQDDVSVVTMTQLLASY